MNTNLWLKQKVCRVPTWRTWLLASVIFCLLAVALLLSIHPFLAVTDPVGGEILIVEGWLPDQALRDAVAAFRNGHYHLIVTTGEPLFSGAPLSGYGTYAELAAAILVSMGVSEDSIRAVPALAVSVNRTFASAAAVRRWLERGPLPSGVDVFTLGAHARRSRDLMQEALGDEVQVGVIAATDSTYDPDRWWTTSRGVERVIEETVGYLYSLVWSPG